MSPTYSPSENIQLVGVDQPGTAEQIEIAVQTYQTTVPFDFEALSRGADRAWVTPGITFGVVGRLAASRRDCLHIVLGLQGNKRVRIYDPDARQLLFYSWKNTIVETMGVRYMDDGSGFVRFITFGGGRRINFDRLASFNAQFLGISSKNIAAVSFGLPMVKDLCFERFVDSLFMIRFAVDANEYRTIDHTRFKSRKPIDPTADRFVEVRSNPSTVVESFEAEIEVQGSRLRRPARVRFEIQGTSGTLRLRFPKLDYAMRPVNPLDLERTFYAVVDEVVSQILTSGIYAPKPPTLEEVQRFDGMAGLADFSEYALALQDADERRQFFSRLDLTEDEWTWLPQLRAVSSLLHNSVVKNDVAALLGELVGRDPSLAVRVLHFCASDRYAKDLGFLVADAVQAEAERLPDDSRSEAEDALVEWAVAHEVDSWDVDLAGDAIGVRHLRFQPADLTLDALPPLLWKVVGALHDRLLAVRDDTGLLLEKYDWCVRVARKLPPAHSTAPAALRLVAQGLVPRRPHEGNVILSTPVSDLAGLDSEVLRQFGLPLWPHLRAVRDGAGVVIANDGVGSALALEVLDPGAATRTLNPARDLVSGESVRMEMPADIPSLRLRFTKYGTVREVVVPIAAASDQQATSRPLDTALDRRRMQDQKRYRKEIDPDGIVIGNSPLLLKMFEEIHFLNATMPPDGRPVAAILLGPTGVGKSHVAHLLHRASSRRDRKYIEVSAGGAGGDPNMQVGEWIGYGKNHGVVGIDRGGRKGRLMEANGGTVFVDEFDALSPELQTIFLSILERKPVRMVGSGEITLDVRCIFASNIDIDAAVESGRLRRDLLARVGKPRITIPTLRERRGDIVALAKHFIRNSGKVLSPACKLALLHYDWPENIREVRQTMESAVARAGDATHIEIDHLDLPAAALASARAVAAADIEGVLWRLADEIARSEGYAPGEGLQRRAGEVLDVGEARASRMYETHLRPPSTPAAEA